ncbi:T9SS type A sorting domain-containing protein [bacterium]|nr:T9SS type A sorting domain-containing protein [bacterium]
MKNALLLVSAAFIFGCALHLLANSSGAPAGRTGSEASNNLTCAAAGCHNGPAPTADHQLTILTNIPINGYAPGFTYAIDVDLDDLQNARPVCGFSASVEDGFGNHVGTLVVSDPGTVSSNGQSKYVTHRSASNTLPNGGRRYSFQWTAPSANPPAQIKIYVAGNFADGTGSTGGDVIRAVSSSFALDPSIGLTEEESFRSIYPNPSPGAFTAVDSKLVPGPARVRLFDLSGRVALDRLERVASATEGVKLEAYTLPRGMYVLQLEQFGKELIRERVLLN